MRLVGLNPGAYIAMLYRALLIIRRNDEEERCATNLLCR